MQLKYSVLQYTYACGIVLCYTLTWPSVVNTVHAYVLSPLDFVCSMWFIYTGSQSLRTEHYSSLAAFQLKLNCIVLHSWLLHLFWEVQDHSQTFPMAGSTSSHSPRLIQLGGLRNTASPPLVGSRTTTWPKTHFYAFRTRKLHLMMTFLIMFPGSGWWSNHAYLRAWSKYETISGVMGYKSTGGELQFSNRELGYKFRTE